jgi:glucosamine 6-phosphate synthetase-like amidotransferase/phosphosugar isomerase protein
MIAMHAGPEIGVASTKAFTASLTDQYLLGCSWVKCVAPYREAREATCSRDWPACQALAGRGSGPGRQ